jgi:hypothetical protein
LFETKHLLLPCSQFEQGNISKLVRLIQEASAFDSLRLCEGVVQTIDILIKEKVGFHSTFHSNTLSD